MTDTFQSYIHKNYISTAYGDKPYDAVPEVNIFFFYIFLECFLSFHTLSYLSLRAFLYFASHSLKNNMLNTLFQSSANAIINAQKRKTIDIDMECYQKAKRKLTVPDPLHEGSKRIPFTPLYSSECGSTSRKLWQMDVMFFTPRNCTLFFRRFSRFASLSKAVIVPSLLINAANKNAHQCFEGIYN